MGKNKPTNKHTDIRPLQSRPPQQPGVAEDGDRQEGDGVRRGHWHRPPEGEPAGRKDSASPRTGGQRAFGETHDPQQSLEEAEKRREKMLEDRKEKAHKEVQHAKEVAAKVKQQKGYVDQRAGKWDSI